MANWHSHHAAVNGIDLHFIEAGTGPPVMLLHGFPEHSYSWRKQIPALAAAGFRAIAPDLRGYNESSRPPRVEDYRLTVVAQDIAALIEHVGAPVALAGHDWGALTAWYVAMTRPELLRKLVILNVPHPVPFSRELHRSTSQKLRMAYQLFFRPPWIPELLMPALLPLMMRRAGRFSAEDIATYRAAWRKEGALRGMANYYRAMAVKQNRRELRELVRRIDIPTLLIFAKHEPVFTRETTEDFDEWVPNLRIARVARAGHYVQTDQPEIVNALLIEFLRPKD
ncbi:MAG TPA: alpha/beta hydrolase [Thermoanaerobaculia bacterium]|nr:alpha/beta hydrolase [Thermoanaerobaculia bacterium]